MSDTVKLNPSNPCPKCGAPIPAGAPQGLCPKCVLLGAATATESGAPATATSEIPSLARVAAAFPQLEVLELIGRGGMGFVFKARQPHLDRFVALKLLPDKLARDPRFTERFNREGRVLAKLNHPNIVSVYDFGQTEHFYFLTMEYVDGVNLRQAMKAGRFSPGEALVIVPEICGALQYAHGQGILHRDIKPENILLDARGQVKIADFGIAKLVGDDKPDVTLTATGAALGTPHYMAPEQLEKPLTVDHRADIYSLGVVFYEMLTGELPIGRFAAPSSKTPVGANVDEVVFRTLEKDRERRYQSAGEMKTQVEHLTDAGAGNFQAAVPKLTAAETVVPLWSLKTIWGAVLVGISLVPLIALLVFIVAADQHGPLAILFIALMTISLPAIPGTILGWMGLSDARAHAGRRGLPLAIFAALTWPLIILIALSLALPASVFIRSTGLKPLFGLLLILPAGTLTFAIWAVYAVARWGANKPPAHRRGVLKWVFIALMLSGTGFLLMNTLPRGQQHHTAPAFGAATERVLPEPAPGVACLLDFESGLLTTPSQDFAMGEKLKNGLPDIGEESVRWLRDSGVDAAVNIPNRGTLRLFEGVALSFSRNQGPPLTWDQFTPADVVEALGKAGWEQGRRFLNSDRTFYETPAMTPNALAFITREGSMGVLEVMGPSAKPRGVKIRYKLMQPPVGGAVVTNSTPWIRFTFTAVELREVKGVRWLAIDYLDDVHGECGKAFPWETDIPGFTGHVRMSEFMTDAKDSSPAVRHQRVEYKMPASAPLDQLELLREKVEKALKQKSLRLELGENAVPLTLFELPGAEGGSFKAGLKVVPPLGSALGGKPPGKTTNGLGALRKLELGIPTLENDSYRSVMVTTDAELPMGEYLIGLLQRPDGRMEELPASTTIYSGAGRTRVMRHLLWPMSLFESNRVRDIAAGMRASLDGRVIELTPDRPAPVFQATNDRGGVTEGFIALRRQSLPAADLPPVSVSIVEVSPYWGPYFLTVKLRISAPPGYMPNAVGVLGDGSELQTHTSISGAAGVDAGCYWYYPREFAAADIKEVTRQLEAIKVLSPNGVRIPPGERVPMFSVTNQAGTIFRGFFELPGADGGTRKSSPPLKTQASNDVPTPSIGWLRGTWIFDKEHSAQKTDELRAATAGPKKSFQDIANSAQRLGTPNAGPTDVGRVVGDTAAATLGMMTSMKDALEMQVVLDLLVGTQMTFDDSEIRVMSRLTPPRTVPYDEIKILNSTNTQLRYDGTNGGYFFREGERFRIDDQDPNPFVALYFKRLEATNAAPARQP